MSYSLNKNQPQLLKLLNEVNPNHRDDRTKLKIVYDDLMKKIDKRRQVSSQNIQVRCRICNKRHLLYFCNYHNCEICGIRGHQKQICDTPIYYINMLYLCKCDARICKQVRSRLAKDGNLLSKNSTHCCYCKNPTKLSDMQMFDRRMKCEICITNDNQSNKGKHTITPPTSPRPEKMVKSPESNNEDEYDPMELIELNPIEESSNNVSNPPTYAQITKADNDTQPKSNPSTSYKHLECLNCGRNTKDNHKKSQMTKIHIDEFTLLCEKCTQTKEDLERYGSTRPIKQCKVCRKYTDNYESRAGGDIVCDSLCNHTLTVINKIYSDGRYNDKISDEYFHKIVTEKCYNTARKACENDDELYEYDSEDTLHPSEHRQIYQQILEKYVIKYINNEFEDKKWKNPEQLKEVLKTTEEIILPEIPTELVKEITDELILENSKNATILFSDEIRENPDSKPQWTENYHPLLPIKDNNPKEWNDEQFINKWNTSKKNDDEINIKITDLVSQQQNGKILIDNLLTTYKQYDDDSKSQPMEIDDQPNQKRLEIPINMVTKENATQTQTNILPDLRNYIPFRKYNKLQNAYDNGKILVNDLKSQNKKLTERLRHLTNLAIGNVRQQEHNYQLYMNEWHVCENLTQQVVQLQGLLDEQRSERLSRRFIMKLQQQTIRNKSQQIDDLTKNNTKLTNEVLELQRIVDERKEWFNPDTSIDVYTPQTRQNMEYIIENCESKPTEEVIMDPDIAALFDSIVWNDQLMIENLTVDSD